METSSLAPEFSFKRFLIRSVLVNVVFTAVFAAILFWCNGQYSHVTANRTTFLLNIIALPVVWTHSLLLLIFAIRRFARKNIVAGLIFFTHFLLSGAIGYWLYIILALYGWAFAMKGN